MKRLFNWAKKKIIDFVKWLWQECKDWRTFVLLVIVCVVIGSPVWICGLLGIIFDWAWAWWVFFGLLAFWWLPGMPYFAVCLAVTLTLKRFWEKRKEKLKKLLEKEDEDTAVHKSESETENTCEKMNNNKNEVE